MHYVPESAREFAQENVSDKGALERERSFHYQSAPIYLLTAVVGLLLAADILIGVVGDPAWLEYRTLFGFRLALLSAVLGGARILYQTLSGLFEGHIGAGLALTIAALAAIILGEHTTAALVVFVALCGESIEGYTVDRAQQAIRRIFNLCPAIAHVIRDGSEIDVPVGEVVVGDSVVIRPGERIPADGRVSAGTSAVDQSALTGESLPVDKAPDDEVFTGTLNQYGSLTVRAERVGAETTLAQVVKLVAEATERKAPLERTADRLARLFLPAVLAAASITLLGWRLYSGAWSDGFLPALAVLVVACPCPLILATPTAVMAAMAWLARTGVVVKGSVALERLATVDTFAFDKTGTLTRGELAIGEMTALPPLREAELLRTAAIAEKRSEHLLSRLIVREAEARGAVLPGVQEFTAHPGSGIVAAVRATVLGPWAIRDSEQAEDIEPHEQRCTVVVGNRRLLESRNIQIPAEIDERLTSLDESGQTSLLVAVDEEVLGVIGVRDTVRAESRDVIAELSAAGIGHFALLTGDREQSAQTVAKSLGLIDTVEAEMLPLDKAQWIEAHTRQGQRVAMVGDGVNDAPGLASATVGLALGGVGSDIAAEAGDLVLMGDPLRPLPGLLRLSRRLVHNIRQSIFIFAFGMNALGVLLCAWGILSPVAGAVFHECSSLAVMLNAMRLLWFERWEETRLGRTSRRLAVGVEWLTEMFSPTRVVFRLVDHWSLLVRLALSAAALYWFTTGLVLISADEEAVVTRFGRFETQLKPGLYWRWPVPLERMTREKVDHVRAIQLGFRSNGPPESAPGEYLPPIEWTSEHKGRQYQPVPRESLVLTGEEVPVEVTAEVHYRISNLRQYVFGSAQPEATLRACAESSIRRVAAGVLLDGILTDRRAGIESECLALIQQRAAEDRLGIEVVELNLLDIHPPKSVVPAYRDVADALEEREQKVNEAKAYYAGKVLGAAGERAIRILSASAGAETDGRHSSTTGEVADWKLDDALWKRLTPESSDGELLLSGEAAATLLSARQKKVERIQAASGAASRFNSVLKVYRDDRMLTGRWMYWKTIEETLSTRPLTIVDPKVSGRQHLLLIDPFELGGMRALEPSFPRDEQRSPFPEPGEPRENRSRYR